MPTNNIAPANQIKIIPLFILTTLLFAPVILELFNVWCTSDDYSHGFFVIPIALYMVWHKRHDLLSVPLKPLWIGFPIFVAGAVTYLVSFIAKFHTLTHLSMIVVILGLFLFLTGWTLTKKLLFPVLFLLFMFPISSAYYVLVTNPLKLMITKISAQIIYLAGIPIYRDGNLLFFANSQLEIAEACSGVRSLYSYLMLGCLFAVMSTKLVSKMVLIVSTIPLALIINVVRVAGTAMLSHYYGSKVAQGFFHEFSGFILFAVGFLLLYSEYHLLMARKAKHIGYC
jgi:exosortase